MASTIVEQTLRDYIQSIDPAVLVVDVEAFRIDNNALPDVFQVLSFQGNNGRRASIGPNPCYREEGVVTVSVIAKSGAGKAVAQTHAELVSDDLNRFRDPTNNIWLMAVSQPENSEQTSDGRWHILRVNASFQRDYFL